MKFNQHFLTRPNHLKLDSYLVRPKGFEPLTFGLGIQSLIGSQVTENTGFNDFNTHFRGQIKASKTRKKL